MGVGSLLGVRISIILPGVSVSFRKEVLFGAPMSNIPKHLANPKLLLSEFLEVTLHASGQLTLRIMLLNKSTLGNAHSINQLYH